MDSLLSFKTKTPAPASRQELSAASSYRFLANIAAADLERAMKVARTLWPAGGFRVVPILCGDLGLPLKGAALYVIGQLTEPESFWHLFHSPAPLTAA